MESWTLSYEICVFTKKRCALIWSLSHGLTNRCWFRVRVWKISWSEISFEMSYSLQSETMLIVWSKSDPKTELGKSALFCFYKFIFVAYYCKLFDFFVIIRSFNGFSPLQGQSVRFWLTSCYLSGSFDGYAR